MLKKMLTVGLVALLAPMVVFAMGERFASPKSVFDGFYLGGALNGVNVFSPVKYSPSIHVTPITGITLNLYGNQTTRSAQDNLGFTLLGGYGKTMNNWFLGGELHARYVLDHSNAAKMAVKADVVGPPVLNVFSGSVSHSRAWMDWDFGLAAKFGWIPSRLFPARNVMFYALVGAELAKFNAKGIKVNWQGVAPIPPAPPGGFTVSNSFNDWVWGFAPGVGMSIAIAHNMFVSMQYVYTFFNNANSTYNIPTGAPAGSIWPAVVPVKTRISPRTGTFSLALNWDLPWNV